MWQLRKIKELVTVPYRKPKPLNITDHGYTEFLFIKGETSHTFILCWRAFRSLIQAFDDLL